MKTKTTAAKAAAQIREILKKEFPGVKFSVTSCNYSMGDSVRINWVDSVSLNKVKNLISDYQYGHFNGMEDIYESNNRRDDIPQTKYLFCERKISDEVYLIKLDELRIKWDVLANVIDINATNQEIFDKCNVWTARQFIYQQFKGFQEIDIEQPKTILN